MNKDFIKTSQSYLDKEKVNQWKATIQKGERPEVLLQTTPEGYYIVDGNHRYQAYLDLGYQDIPARILSPQDMTKYIFYRRLN